MSGTDLRKGFALALLAGAIAGCRGDEPEDADSRERPRSVEGTYVGRVAGGDALIAISAAPVPAGSSGRELTVFACDGTDTCEWMSGTARGNRFSVVAADGDARASGELTRRAVSGSVKLGGERLEYTAARATAAAGLYTLTISPGGRLEGASAGGVGLRGRSTLPRPGRGTLRLADGTRLGFRAVQADGDALRIRRGEARLIVMPNGRLSGAGSSFYMRSRG